jgi:hypothetical protein
MRPLDSNARKELQGFGHLLHAQAFSKLREQAARFPNNRPESGVRSWSELGPDAGAQEFLTIIRLADASFQFATARVEEMLVSLRRWFALATLASLLILVHAYHVAFIEEVTFKQLSPWLTYGLWTDVSGALLLGIGVSMATFLIYWNIGSRLARRKRFWNCFKRACAIGDSPAETRGRADSDRWGVFE